MDTTKKVIEVGEKSGHKATATVTVEDVHNPDLNQRNATRTLRKVGTWLTPVGFDYTGSAVVHYYQTKKSLLAKPEYKTITQVTLDSDVEEGFADFGWKRLQVALMSAFGKTPPAIRQDIVTEKE